MSTHNIGFYEGLTKIIFELSSKIKYAPYLLCWISKDMSGFIGELECEKGILEGKLDKGILCVES